MSWASVISGGASIVGGLLGKSSADKATEASLTNAANNNALQKEFAKQGIRWRVNDAKKAGIHPLYAMGASIPGFTPSSVSLGGDNSLGRSIASAGQDVGRSVAATQTKTEREGSIAYKLSLERASLENDLLRSEIARNTAQMGPPLPSGAGGNPHLPGQGLPPGVEVSPVQYGASTSYAQPHQEAGAAADTGFVRTSGGGLAIVPSLDAKERIEDQLGPEVAWAIRNQMVPFFSPSTMRSSSRTPSTKQYPLPAGMRWRWSTLHQEYRPHPIYKPTKSRYGSPYHRRKRPAKPGWGDVFTGA